MSVLQPAAESGDDGPEPAQLEEQLLLLPNLHEARVVHGVLVDIVRELNEEAKASHAKLIMCAYVFS